MTVAAALVIVACNAVIVACSAVIWWHDPSEVAYRAAKRRCRELMRDEGR